MCFGALISVFHCFHEIYHQILAFPRKALLATILICHQIHTTRKWQPKDWNLVFCQSFTMIAYQSRWNNIFCFRLTEFIWELPSENQNPLLTAAFHHQELTFWPSTRRLARILWRPVASEEKAHNLAAHVLAACFLVIHDAIGCGPSNQTGRKTATSIHTLMTSNIQIQRAS